MARPCSLPSLLLLCGLLLGPACHGSAAAPLPSEAEYSAQVRYHNLGLALIRDGRGDQGITVLDRVGRLDSRHPALRALADRANLALALHLLERGKADVAIPVLGRIGSDGAAANRALLALGWAWLLPSGPVPTPAELGDERSQGPPPESFTGRAGAIRDSNLYQRYRLRPLVRASIPDLERARLTRALAVWAALGEREPDDPDVIEGLIAMAGALDRLGAATEALHRREQALAALEARRRQLDQALRLASADAWIDALLGSDDSEAPGDDWQPRSLPTPALAGPLAEALAGERFQSALRALHDNRVLRGNVADRPAQLDADQRQQRERLKALAIAELRDQLARSEARRAAVHFAVARQFDGLGEAATR